MNSNHIMIVLIVAIVMIAGIFRGRSSGRARRWRDEEQTYDGENQQLRDEVKALKERIAVLERIATDRSSTLESEIERLRDQ